MSRQGVQIVGQVQVQRVSPPHAAQFRLPAVLAVGVIQLRLHHRQHHYTSESRAVPTIIDRRCDVGVVRSARLVVLHQLHNSERVRAALRLLVANAADGVGGRDGLRGRQWVEEGTALRGDKRVRDLGGDDGITLKSVGKCLPRVQ